MRAAGLYYVSSRQTASDVTKSCYYAYEILRAQANIRNRGAACANSRSAVDQTMPVALTTSSVASGPDGQPSTTVTLTYQTIPMIPIPFLLTRQLTITRSVQYKE